MFIPLWCEMHSDGPHPSELAGDSEHMDGCEQELDIPIQRMEQ